MGPARFQVKDDARGRRLDIFVAEVMGIARTQAQRLISEGAVTVNGAILNKNHRLQPGDCVQIEPPPPKNTEPDPQGIPIKIVYQDDDLAVVSKPAGMVVHPAAGHREGTLVNALLHALGELSGIGGRTRPGIVHRLDRDTSGLMVVAKNDSSHIILREMVRKRSINRIYLALVHGVPETRLGTIEAPVGRNPRDRKRMAVTSESGRPSVTHFRVLRSYANSALLEVELETGRTHQIRVHLAFIGHPVVGDREYGRPGPLEEKLELSRQFLHAKRLVFPHPVSGKELVFEDPLPADLERALRKLEAQQGASATNN